MEERWKSRGFTMPETNIKQALMPDGIKKLINTKGTAPGITFNKNNKNIFILPGPPNEFIPLVRDEVVPFLENNFTKRTKKDYKFILFYNQAESSFS